MADSFSYIGELGPFCDIKVEGSSLAGTVRYKAVTDIYVTEMIVDGEEGNLDISFQSFEEFLDISAKVKKFRGKLKILIHISEAKSFGIRVPAAEEISNLKPRLSWKVPTRSLWRLY